MFGPPYILCMGGLLPPSSWLKPWTLADRNYVCAICFLVCLSKGESIIDLRDYWAGLLALVYLPIFCKEQFFFFFVLLLLCDVPNLGRSKARAQGVCWKFLCLCKMVTLEQRASVSSCKAAIDMGRKQYRPKQLEQQNVMSFLLFSLNFK